MGTTTKSRSGQLARRSTLAVGAIAAAFAMVAATPVSVDDPVWNVDAAHTQISFTVKHFFTPVTGSFTDFAIDLRYDAEAPAASTVSFVAQVASISTGNEDRNAHLQSGDFFEAETFPEITFQSTSVREASPGQLVATGDLTIKGVTRSVDLAIAVLGVQEVPEEMREMLGGVVRVASFSADTQINRRDFGVGVGSWAATLVVGGEVDISIALEANQS